MKIKAKVISKNNFSDYGQVHNMLDREAAGFGNEAFTFYRDSIRYCASSSNLGISTLSVSEDSKYQVRALEHHNYTAELMMPMDDDMVVCLARAGSAAEPCQEEMEAFIVPRNTMIHLNPGVWHYMPLPMNNREVNVLVVLPERAYHNDLTSVDMSEKELFIEF